jgi:hypothetical protein
MSAARRRFVDRLPTAPMLLVGIFVTLGVCLIQNWTWLGVGLVISTVLWLGILKILFDRYRT